MALLPEAQLAFLTDWKVDIERLDSDQAHAIYANDCEGTFNVLQELNDGLALRVYDLVLSWTVCILGEGDLENLKSPNNRNERMAMWLARINHDDVCDMLAPLRGDLTEAQFKLPSTDLLDSPMRPFCISLARLADCILLFHICQDQESSQNLRYNCLWNFSHMRAIAKGFFISAVDERELNGWKL